jgi:hypothetical protein
MDTGRARGAVKGSAGGRRTSTAQCGDGVQYSTRRYPCRDLMCTVGAALVLRSACTPAAVTMLQKRRLREASSGRLSTARNPLVRQRQRLSGDALHLHRRVSQHQHGLSSQHQPRHQRTVHGLPPAHTSRTAAPWRRPERTQSPPVQPPAAAPAPSPAAHPAAPPTRPPSPSPAAAALAASRNNLTGMERQRHRPPVLLEVPALHCVLYVWWVCLAAACGRADTA